MNINPKLWNFENNKPAIKSALIVDNLYNDFYIDKSLMTTFTYLNQIRSIIEELKQYYLSWEWLGIAIDNFGILVSLSDWAVDLDCMMFQSW